MQYRRTVVCSPHVVGGVIAGAVVGLVLSLVGAAYQDQLIAATTAMGASMGFLAPRSRKFAPPLGDPVLVGALLSATVLLTGWHLNGGAGIIVGAALAGTVALGARLLLRG